MADVQSLFLQDAIKTYRMYKSLGDRAIAQVRSDADLNRLVGPESNSIAIIVKHVGGNFRSRFRDFLTSDGEKPDRDRDAEFDIAEAVPREEVLRWWDEGWAIAMAAIEALTPADLDRTIVIRGHELKVVEALNRSVTHTAYHVGQIVFLARHLVGAEWTSLSIPRGASESFNAAMKRST